VNLVQQYIDESNAWRTERVHRFGESQSLLGMPRFGLLKLGTGNGMSRVVGAEHPLKDLKTIVDYAPGRTHTIPLIEQVAQGAGRERFFFAGLGYDSLVLNDFNALKAATQSRWLKPFTTGLAGYFTAVLTRTIPRLLLNPPVLEGRVVNRGRAYYIDPRRGDAAVEIAPGETLFEGRAQMIAAGTCPFYGFGFRIFPFANIMPGMMHLRIASMGPISALAQLPAAWKGSLRSPGDLLDFVVEDVSVELDQPFPFQHSGDAQGMRQELGLRIGPEPLRLVDCHRPRPVTSSMATHKSERARPRVVSVSKAD
jgi:diacylglycerol kinase family enzyme